MARKEVEIFTLCMEEKLRRNDHKGGWENCTTEDLFKRLKAEIEELEEAIANESDVNVMFEAADVANFAMMIAWNAMKVGKERNGGKTGMADRLETWTHLVIQTKDGFSRPLCSTDEQVHPDQLVGITCPNCLKKGNKNV